MVLLCAILIISHSTAPLECDHAADIHAMDRRIRELTLQLNQAMEDRDTYKDAINLASLMQAGMVISETTGDMGGR